MRLVRQQPLSALSREHLAAIRFIAPSSPLYVSAMRVVGFPRGVMSPPPQQFPALTQPQFHRRYC
jgi:hypothetical protein